MSERTRRWRESVDAYEAEVEHERVTARHRRERVRVARKVGVLLENANLSCDPRFFGERELNYLLEGPWRELTGNGKAYNANLLHSFLESRGNLTVKRARLRFDRTPVRPKLTFTLAERERLLDTARRFGIVQYGMVVLMLTMGLRPSEVRRLKVAEALREPVTFLGKRRGIEQGLGKVRKVPAYPLFRDLLPELLAHRRQTVSASRRPDPGFLFCHVARTDVWNRKGALVQREGDIVGWGKAWMDRHFIAPVFDTAGLHAQFNLNYRARRTFGRALRVEQGHQPERVARLMGHSDPYSLPKYLGLTDDEDRDAMATLRNSFGRPRVAVKKVSKGGRIGHAG